MLKLKLRIIILNNDNILYMESMKECKPETYEKDCPVFDVHDKMEESFYFLISMIENYHMPCVFRYSLNAFIQSIRGVTFYIQSNKSKIKSFDSWYFKKQQEMKRNVLLSKICEARNFLVHKGMLEGKSRADFGLFRGRRIKLCFSYDLDKFIDSTYEMKRLIAAIKQSGIDFVGNHSALNEQYGLKRVWIVEKISDKEIATVCYEAYIQIANIVRELHEMFNYEFIPSGLTDGFIETNQVLLETDIDPGLIKKWGWSF